MTVLYSIFEDEQKLLKSIIKLHCSGGIELDPMYSKGHFYKRIRRPKLCFDIIPQSVDVKKADARKLPLKNASIGTMVLDPPFCFGIHGKTESNISAKRFTMLEDWQSLRSLYRGIIKEAYRILKPQGILIFKCQDYTDSKTTMTHCFVWKWARQQKFYAKDLAILINKNRIYNPKLKQRHLRKAHTYFWVFKK